MYTKKNDELMHYGVLGMKWGMHKYTQRDGSPTKRALKKGHDYEYVSRATKKRMKRAERAEAKGSADAKTLRKRAEASKSFDKMQQQYAKQTSVGKNLVQKFVLSSAERTYTMARSQGKGRVESLLRTTFDVNLGITGSSVQQHRMREKYIDAKTGTKSTSKLIKAEDKIINKFNNDQTRTEIKSEAKHYKK